MNGLSLLDTLVEARIAEAMAAGEFDHLPGTGRPLALDDDLLIAPELRAAYRILKNGGFVPPELEARREIAEIQALIPALDDDVARRRAMARLTLLELRLEASRVRRLRHDHGYYRRLVERFGAR